MSQRHFFSHLPSPFPVIFATATVLAFVLLRNSRFNCHCYTQREATPTQKSARKRHSDLSRLLARKITKGIHSCKPASLNRPIGTKVRLLDAKSLVQMLGFRQTFRHCLNHRSMHASFGKWTLPTNLDAVYTFRRRLCIIVDATG